jgi:hypothetical protein
MQEVINIKDRNIANGSRKEKLKTVRMKTPN